jgi:hypothetical protein
VASGINALAAKEAASLVSAASPRSPKNLGPFQLTPVILLAMVDRLG